MITRATNLVWMLLLAVGCAGEAQRTLALEGRTMGTGWTVQIVAPPRPVERAGLRAAIEADLEQVNALMSTYREDSELSRFNRSPPEQWFELSADTAAVLDQALQMSAMSGGAFDVTVKPLVDLWGFGADLPQRAIPADEEVSNALAAVGYELLERQPGTTRLRKQRAQVTVDLSAIAKGYAVDRVAQRLEQHGITRYLVDIGGELRVRGHNAAGEPWRIAIERPDDQARVIHSVIGLTHGAVATSGDYRNFFESGGRRYSHTLDPRTGRPVTHDLAAVTVIHDTAMEADALATALLVLGKEMGLTLAEREGVAALFLVRDGDKFHEIITTLFRQRTGLTL